MTHSSKWSLFREVPAFRGNGRMYSRGERVRFRPGSAMTISSPATARQSVLSSAGVERSWTRSRRSSMGTPRCEVPVSTMPWHSTSLHMLSSRPPTLMADMETFQCPSSASVTATQDSGPRMRAGLWPPRASSLPRPLSSSARKKANCVGAMRPMTLARQLRKLKSVSRASFGKESPTMPSNVAVSKRTDICRATSTFAPLQIFRLAASGAPWPAAVVDSRHTTSRTTSAYTLPVPKPTVTVSRTFLFVTQEPSMLMSTAVLDMELLYRSCFRQELSEQLMEATIACAEPVSKTTLNS
mmetsp:Transcript_32294/g.93001  ORF Transcript_32294/g.93001 Transcript_32294/m.93001 type:complete len:298 (+) Transcript_32294:510-1403(+)